MTEAEWVAATDPRELLDYHRMKKHPRRLRLLAAACVRRVMPADMRAEEIIDVVERYADGEASRADFLFARKRVRTLNPSIRPFAGLLGRYRGLTDDAMEGLTAAIGNARLSTTQEGIAAECGLIRCVFGNPFRPVAVDPSWLTSTVVALAEGIYADRAFDRMPILADALMDAGCDNDDVLTHSRGDGPHVRGCWVVDLVTGRA